MPPNESGAMGPSMPPNESGAMGPSGPSMPPNDSGAVGPSGPDADWPEGDGGPWGACVDDGCLAGLHCNTSSGQCVPCLEDTNCTDQTLTVCDLTPRDPFENFCVECVQDEDCGQDEECLTNQCVQSCSSGRDCKASAATCDRDLCISCRQSSDCDKGKVCSGVTGRCGECTVDSDCPSYKSRCDPRTNICERCLSNADCGGGFCDLLTESCGGGKMWDE